MKKGIRSPGISQYVFTIKCQLGEVRYSVIGNDQGKAYAEVAEVFKHDQQFKFNNVNTLNSYQGK